MFGLGSRLAAAARHFFGSADHAPRVAAPPQRPRTVEMPTPAGRTPETWLSPGRWYRARDAEAYLGRRAMAPGSASTLKKAMRARRIANGTQGFDSMRDAKGARR